MLNFKGWNKIKEDKDSTTLKHDKGHEMKLAHKGLPKIQKEALKRLKFAEGGAAPEKTFQAPTQTAQTPEQAPSNVLASTNVPSMTYPEGTINPNAAAQSVPKEAAIRQQAEANMAQGEVERQKQLLQAQDIANQTTAAYNNKVNDSFNQLNQFNKDNPLKENAYLENMGAGKKMSTAIGLILGGAGAGVSGGPNVAYDFLNKQIDRNINAQKERFGQQKTIWEGAHQLFGDNQAADAFTRAHQYEFAKTQANIQAAKMGTPMAAANAIKLNRELGEATQGELQKTAGRLSQLPNAQQNMPLGTNLPPGANQQQGTPKGANGEDLSSFVSPSKVGPIGVEASVPKNQEHDDVNDPILAQDAWKKTNDLQYSTDQDKANYPKAFEQYTKAQQADTTLGQLHEVMGQLASDAQAGGGSGYLRRHDPTGHIPFLGPLISGSTVQPSTATEVNKRYDAYKTRITNDVLTALKGTDASPDQIRDMIESNVPERSDTADLIARKERNIRIFIKNNIQRSMLEGYGISNKRR